MYLYTMDSIVTENSHTKVRIYKPLVRCALKYGRKTHTLMQLDQLNCVLLKEESYVKYIVLCKRKENKIQSRTVLALSFTRYHKNN